MDRDLRRPRRRQLQRRHRSGGGVWSVTEAEVTAGIEITALPENSDADFTLVVTPYSQDADNATPTAFTPQNLLVVIDAVADTPTLTLDLVAADDTASGDEGTAIALPDIAASLNDTDASETLALEISGLPAGWTLSDGTYSSTDPTTDVTGWNLTTLTVTGPAEDDADFTLTVTATATEAATVDGDATDGPELGETDNVATTSWQIDVTVSPVNDEATVVTNTAYGEEDLGVDAVSVIEPPASTATSRSPSPSRAAAATPSGSRSPTSPPASASTPAPIWAAASGPSPRPRSPPASRSPPCPKTPMPTSP